MGILTNIEESLSSKVAAALLVSASFSPFLRTAVASEGVSTESQPAIPISVAEIDKSPEYRQLIRPYSIVRNDSELAQVWTDRQSVYVDKAVIEKGVNPETFNKLAERINKDFPNWSVYVTTPGKLFKEDPSKWQEMMEERLNSIVEDQFKDLTRFNINRDESSGVKNQSIILLCYGQGDLPTVLSWASPGDSYVKYGLDQNYWTQNIASEIGREIAKSGDIEEAVSNAITSFEDALTHRIFAAEEEQNAQVLKIREQVNQERDYIFSGLQKISKKLEEEVSDYDPSAIKKIEDAIELKFEQIERYLKEGRTQEVESQLKHINNLFRLTSANATELANSLEIVDAAKKYIEEAKAKWFFR